MGSVGTAHTKVSFRQSVWGSDVLRRRKAKGSRSESEPIDDSALVFPGSIRTPGEDEGLTVEISKSGGDIVMRTDKAELGRWPLVDVTIHPIDATSFAFVAEGDRLVFSPSDSAVFGASSLVTVEVVEGGRRKRRKAKKGFVAIESAPVRSEAPTRKEQKAATKDFRIASAAEASAGSSESTETTPTPESLEESPVTVGAPNATAETESVGPLAELGDVHQRPSRGWRPRRWVWLIDVARRNRFFDLDRVPIDETLRGFEHEHSWDHRVATRRSVASHVCTICGKIRF